MARRINWKAFRRGFYDGFSGAPLWRAIVKIWNRRTLMTDIVERLLAPAYWMSGSSEGHEGDNSAPIEAAKTIESLRSELAKVNMEVDRLTRTNEAKREHRDKLLEATAKQAAEIEKLRTDYNTAREAHDRRAAEVIALRAALREAADELDAYYRAEYPGDHPYSQRKLAEAIAANPARAALEEK